MPLQTFSFPFPETRFIRAGGLIYKFKIRAGSSYSGEEVLGGNLSQEVEVIIRTVLGNLDSLQPFSSTHFNVFPYKKQWEGASKVMCKHSEKTLRAYPFILILYVERNTQTEKQSKEKLSPHCCVSELQSKRCTGDSPLEDATLKDLSEDAEAEHQVPVVCRLNMDSPQAEKQAYEESDKLKSGGSAVTGSGPGKVHPEGTQEDEGEEQWGEEGENPDTGPGNCESSGILTQLARQIFPFSWFLRGP